MWIQTAPLHPSLRFSTRQWRGNFQFLVGWKSSLLPNLRRMLGLLTNRNIGNLGFVVFLNIAPDIYQSFISYKGGTTFWYPPISDQDQTNILWFLLWVLSVQQNRSFHHWNKNVVIYQKFINRTTVEMRQIINFKISGVQTFSLQKFTLNVNTHCYFTIN